MYSSSQSFAPMSRLLWKEYRAQRALWGVMLLLGLVPQVLLRILIGDPGTQTTAVWMTVAAAPMIFIIGSVAILFAGEREERTSDWLQQLAVPPLWLLLAKSSFVLLASLALMVSLSAAAVLLVWALPAPAAGESGFAPVAWTLWNFAGFVLWGSFGSLLSRRVITAVPAMGFWWLMTMVVPVIWLPPLLGVTYLHPGHQRVQEILIVLSFILVGAADVWLGWRWCRGKYLDAQVLDDLNARVSAWIGRLRGQTAAPSRIPNRIEFANSWRREWQRLTWQERYRESYHRSLLYVGCGMGPMLGGLGAWLGNDLMPGVLPLVVAFPLAMGVLGFRYDGEGQPRQFLAHRGVSPRVLWLAKHVVWFPRAVWIPLVVWLVAFAVQLAALVPSVRGPSEQPLFQVSAQAWMHREWVLWFIVLSYGCGHLAAMALHRVLLAVVSAVALCLVLTGWLAAMVILQVPLWWSVGGLAAWLYLLSCVHAPQWLMERPIRGGWMRAAGLAVVPPAVLALAVGAWRAGAVWSIAPDPDIAAEIDRQMQPISPDDKRALDQLAETMGGFNTVKEIEQSDGGSNEEGPAAEERFWTSNESRLQAILQFAGRDRGVSPARWLAISGEWPAGGLLPQQRLLLEAGRLRTEEGRLNDALQYYCASLRLASFWATDFGMVTRREAESQQLHTLASVVAWGDHPDQTGASLRAAVKRVRAELELFPPIRQTLVADFRRDLQRLNELRRMGWASPATDQDRGQPVWQVAVAASRYIPWEQFRARQLLLRRLIESDRSNSRLSAALNRPGLDVSRLIGRGSLDANGESRHLWEGTPALSGFRSYGRELHDAAVQREVVVRESLLALSLLAWRRDHRLWPQSLGDLLAGDNAVPAVTIVDPWSGELFHYNGDHLNRQILKVGAAVLLNTVGQDHLRDVYVDDPRDGHGTAANGSTIATTNWLGASQQPFQDDRLKLEIAAGQLILRIPGAVPK